MEPALYKFIIIIIIIINICVFHRQTRHKQALFPFLLALFTLRAKTIILKSCVIILYFYYHIKPIQMLPHTGSNLWLVKPFQG